MEIQHAGEALACLYRGQFNEGLDKLHYRKFCEKVFTSTAAVQVHALPAAKNHSARLYYTRCKSGWVIVHWIHNNGDVLWQRVD